MDRGIGESKTRIWSSVTGNDKYEKDRWSYSKGEWKDGGEMK